MKNKKNVPNSMFESQNISKSKKINQTPFIYKDPDSYSYYRRYNKAPGTDELVMKR
ncbi:MAG: hypothetical protein PHH85_10700 [Candidatus Methanoperedens sp.]|nr:hypothetical protein [Candidatus Methanoperedens sp.]